MIVVLISLSFYSNISFLFLLFFKIPQQMVVSEDLKEADLSLLDAVVEAEDNSDPYRVATEDRLVYDDDSEAGDSITDIDGIASPPKCTSNDFFLQKRVLLRLNIASTRYQGTKAPGHQDIKAPRYQGTY